MNKSAAHKETPSVQATTNADLRTECCGFSIIFWYQSDPQFCGTTGVTDSLPLQLLRQPCALAHGVACVCDPQMN